MGIAGTTPRLREFYVRISLELKNIWSEVIMAIRLRICGCDLGNNWAVASTPVVVPSTTGVSRLSLPLYLGESDEIID